MKTYSSIDYTSEQPTVCALGCFDGVHIGHASIIKKAKEIATKSSALCAVWSFSEPPKNFFAKEKTPLLTTKEEKARIMERFGVDVFLSIPFDEHIASMSAEDFFYSILVGSMKAKHLVCGFNYRFGNNGKGDCALLEKLCKENDMHLSVIPPVTENGITISSSEIRNSLSLGDAISAAAYLGRPYSLTAQIINGQHLGRTLGFPTVNQVFGKEKLIPKNGVYVSRIILNETIKYGITNIGVRPTVDGNTLCAETNLFDFSGDLYEKTVTVELLEFMRAEQRFESLDQLKTQVNNDIKTAKEIITKKYAV